MKPLTRNDVRFIRLSDVKLITGLSRSTIYKKIANNEFPRQISVGSNSVVWVKHQIDDWCDEMIALSAC